MFRPLWLCLVFVLVPSVLARGHELPDGEIDRRVQVSVKADCVLVEYSLRMNEVTLGRELGKNGLKPAHTVSDRWKQYQKSILSSLPMSMRVTADGDRLNLQPIRADYSGWGHPRLTCLLKADAKLTEQLKTIAVSDRNFLNTPGQYRIAMKGRSGAEMKKASVSPTISRAKPVDWLKLTKQERQAVARAEGVFVVRDRKRDTDNKPKTTSQSTEKDKHPH